MKPSQAKPKTRPVGGKRKTPRSEIISVRLEPQLRFAAELAAAKTRNTLSTFIELAVDKAVRELVLIEAVNGGKPSTAADVSVSAWEPHPADRLVRMHFKFPELLTLSERRLWRVITEQADLWEETNDHSLILNRTRLKSRWDHVCAIADGRNETE